MGLYGRICGERKSNESFSGKGHRNHICKVCSKLPKEKINSIDQKDEIVKFLFQLNISAKNISRLQLLGKSEDMEASELAELVPEVAKVKPHKKKRVPFLMKKRKDLFEKLYEAGLIFEYYE